MYVFAWLRESIIYTPLLTAISGMVFVFWIFAYGLTKKFISFVTEEF